MQDRYGEENIMKKSVAMLVLALALPWSAHAAHSLSPGVPLRMDEMANVVAGSFAPWNAGLRDDPAHDRLHHRRY